jgi:glycine cleavage system H protein
MDVEGYNMPEDLYYEENHYWVKAEGELLLMGMDDFAQKLAGKIVFVQLPEPGKALEAGNRFAKVESGKWLGKGWMYKIKPADKADLAKLIHGADAIRKWVVEDIAKFSK